ncbi:MAG: DUF1622 domain-containing protein [Erysipelothrix sp.]|nr:DUF1622 domain-containing protein [Erysipelothrix sp.]
MQELFNVFVEGFIFIIDILSVIIILYGVIKSIIYLLDRKPTNPGYVLGQSLELGLRYLMVGEVLRSVISHAPSDLYALAIILVIRIVIVFVNQKEMEHELKEDTQAAKARMKALEEA